MVIGRQTIQFSGFRSRTDRCVLPTARFIQRYIADAPVTDALSIPQSDSNHQTAQIIAQASRTTVDLDKQVHLLVENDQKSAKGEN